MRSIKSVATLVAMTAAAVAFVPNATAQEDVIPSFTFEGVQRPGGQFKVIIRDGTCPGGPVSLTSPGFVAPVDLPSLTGTFVAQDGAYTATLKCKDTTKVGEVWFTLTEPAPPRSDPFLDKAEYSPGEKIRIHLERGYKCNGPATSEGFSAPAELTMSRPPGGDGYSLDGETTAGNAPGAYQATIKCLTGSVSNKFTVKAPPTTTTPPGNPAPKPKPPIVKPKGAPDTGGGGTA